VRVSVYVPDAIRTVSPGVALLIASWMVAKVPGTFIVAAYADGAVSARMNAIVNTVSSLFMCVPPIVRECKLTRSGREEWGFAYKSCVRGKGVSLYIFCSYLPFMVRKKTSRLKRKESYLGHRTNKGFFLIIGLLIVLIVIIILLNFRANMELRADKQELRQQIANLEAERDALQEAYGIVLEDAKAFGEIYRADYEGADIGVDVVNNDSVIPEAPAEGAVTLSDTDVWGFYNAQGIILDECIDTTKLVQTPDELVEILIVGSGEDAVLRVLVDAQEVGQVLIAGEESLHTLAVNLAKGTHYLDLVYSTADTNGPVTINLIRVGDRTLETAISTLDYGIGFAVFDCEKDKRGDTLKKNGAMRFKIEKA